MKNLKELQQKLGEILDQIESIDLSEIKIPADQHKRLRVKTHGIYHKVMLFHSYVRNEVNKATKSPQS